jgi:hypothetical protein
MVHGDSDEESTAMLYKSNGPEILEKIDARGKKIKVRKVYIEKSIRYFDPILH